MAKHLLMTTTTTTIFLLLNLSFLLPCLSCPTCPNPSPPPPPKPKPPVACPPPPLKTTPRKHKCPIDTLKLDACVDTLGGLVHIGLGKGATAECCPVVKGLAGLDAGLCLCTAIKAKMLNLNVLLPIALKVLLDCGKRLPADYKCPA